MSLQKTIQLWSIVLLGLCYIAMRCDARAVNVSNTWTMPQEGLNVFYRFFRDRISWFEADAVCQFHHANLVTVDNSFQFDATRDLLRELDVNDIVWIGLMRPQSSERFMWSNSRPLVTDTGYWAESLPLMDAPLCAVIDPIRDYRWHALRCGGPETASFLCEMPVPAWADACILKDMPNLTMQYMADTASIELIRNCAEEGLLRQGCKGKQDRDRALRELICPRERLEAQRINDITNSHFKSLQIINSIRTDKNENNDIELLPLGESYGGSSDISEQVQTEKNTVQRLIEQFNVDELMQADEPTTINNNNNNNNGYKIPGEIPKPVKKSAKKVIVTGEYQKKDKTQQKYNTEALKQQKPPEQRDLALDDMMMGDQAAQSGEPEMVERGQDDEVSNEIMEPLPHKNKILPQDLKTMPPITERSSQLQQQQQQSDEEAQEQKREMEEKERKEKQTIPITTSTTTTSTTTTTTTAAPTTSSTTTVSSTTTTKPTTTTSTTTAQPTTAASTTTAPTTSAATKTTAVHADGSTTTTTTPIITTTTVTTTKETATTTALPSTTTNSPHSTADSASSSTSLPAVAGSTDLPALPTDAADVLTTLSPSADTQPPATIGHPMHPQQPRSNIITEETQHPHIKESADNSHFIPPMLLVKSHYVPQLKHSEHGGEHHVAHHSEEGGHMSAATGLSVDTSAMEMVKITDTTMPTSDAAAAAIKVADAGTELGTSTAIIGTTTTTGKSEATTQRAAVDAVAEAAVKVAKELTKLGQAKSAEDAANEKLNEEQNREKDAALSIADATILLPVSSPESTANGTENIAATVSTKNTKTTISKGANSTTKVDMEVKFADRTQEFDVVRAAKQTRAQMELEEEEAEEGSAHAQLELKATTKQTTATTAATPAAATATNKPELQKVTAATTTTTTAKITTSTQKVEATRTTQSAARSAAEKIARESHLDSTDAPLVTTTATAATISSSTAATTTTTKAATAAAVTIDTLATIPAKSVRAINHHRGHEHEHTHGHGTHARHTTTEEPATTHNFLKETTAEPPYHPNRKRVLTQPETISYFKKILG